MKLKATCQLIHDGSRFDAGDVFDEHRENVAKSLIEAGLAVAVKGRPKKHDSGKGGGE